jgi:hypothetical protein
VQANERVSGPLGFQQSGLTPGRCSVSRFPRNGDSASANQLFDAKRLKHINHRFDFFDISGYFDGVSARG